MTSHGAFWKMYGIASPMAKSPPAAADRQADDDRLGPRPRSLRLPTRRHLTRLKQIARELDLVLLGNALCHVEQRGRGFVLGVSSSDSSCRQSTSITWIATSSAFETLAS
jgi:hypothetical protein